MDFKYRKELIEIGWDIESIEAGNIPSDEKLNQINIIEKYLAMLESFTNLTVIDKSDAGSCDRCGAIGAVIDFHIKPEETERDYLKQCIGCSVERLNKTVINIMVNNAADHHIIYAVLNNYDLRVISNLMSRKILAPRMPDVVLHECPACQGSLVHPDEWPNTSITGIMVGDKIAHPNCTWTCTECLELELTVYQRNPRIRNQYELDYQPIHLACLIKKLQKELNDPNITTIHDIPSDMLCSSCDNYSLNNELAYFDWLDNVECSHCANNYRSCNECGWDYTAHQMDDHDCEGNQNSAYDEDDEDNGDRRIHNYSYKPCPQFQGNDSHVYTGLELEVEASEQKENLSDGVDLMLSKWNHAFYLKYDGSIDYGFEIVSHPHTLKAWHDVDWSFLASLQKMGYRSWNTTTCGIHVHLGLDAFKNEAHEIRFAKLIYDNQRQVERIAGRSNSGYASFEKGKGSAVKKIKNKSMDSNHFAALNVSNGITFEIRVFKGSLRKERVLSAIEFVNALCEYSRNMKVSYQKKPFSWGAFVSYVGNNIDLYPNLFIIINETFETATEIEREQD